MHRKNEKNLCIHCMLNRLKFELGWLNKLRQISLYFIITQLNHVSPIVCCTKNDIVWSPLFCIKSASKYPVIRKLTNETHICSCLTHLITKTTTTKRCLKKQSREDLVPSKVCKISDTREFEYCRGSWFGSYSKYVAFILFSPMP